MTTPEQMDANKKNVVVFYDFIINKKDFESARQYMGPQVQAAESFGEGLSRGIGRIRKSTDVTGRTIPVSCGQHVNF